MTRDCVVDRSQPILDGIVSLERLSRYMRTLGRAVLSTIHSLRTTFLYI